MIIKVRNGISEKCEMFIPNRKNITRLINVHAKNMNSKMAQENANNKHTSDFDFSKIKWVWVNKNEI